ncbi:MAG: ABC transporter ATP-binding protein [Nocardioidaceae bacterium]|nr:ABC transporter ATP-binding protein [Nocardioidaceae bacterium]
MTQPPLLALEGITKHFGDLVANEDVSLEVASGEVLAMLGENGAGKSTLMKVAYGLLRPDSGSVSMGGQPLDIDSPRDAMAAGIGMVTQEFSLVDTMTVAENVALSAVGWGRVDARATEARVLATMERVGVHLDPHRLVSTLAIGERQRVEIVKALFHDCRVLILDEPTAVLPPQDIRALLQTVERLREGGLGVLFVSHKLKEVAEISDRVVVLRRGHVVAERRTSQVGPDELARLMMGVADGGAGEPATAEGEPHPAPGALAHAAPEDGEPVLTISDLVVTRAGRDVVDHLDLTVRRGEIVGVAGISGNGQTELVQAVSGMTPVRAGTILVDGVDVTDRSVADRLGAGLGRLTEDRRGSCVAQLTVEQNLVLEDLSSYTRRGALDRTAIRDHARAMIEQFEIKAEPTTPIGQLSGGNIQKVLLARALFRRPRILLAAQPTRGLDIGTFGYVHTRLSELRASGAGVLLVSEDLDELRALADRIVVVFRGAIVGELSVAEATSERLGVLMTGRDAA